MSNDGQKCLITSASAFSSVQRRKRLWLKSFEEPLRAKTSHSHALKNGSRWMPNSAVFSGSNSLRYLLEALLFIRDNLSFAFRIPRRCPVLHEATPLGLCFCACAGNPQK